MSKPSEKPIKESTAKDNAKAVGNVFLGIGEAVLGATIVTAIAIGVVCTAGSALVLGEPLVRAFGNGLWLAADGGSRVWSPKKTLQSQQEPPTQKIDNEEERRKLEEQAKALELSKSKNQEQSQSKSQQQSSTPKPQQYQQPAPKPQQYQPQQPPMAQQVAPPLQHGYNQKVPMALPVTNQQKSAITQAPSTLSNLHSKPHQKSSSRGTGAELLHKIKKNPWKTAGTLLLATSFPVGTVIAGVIAAAMVAKSGYDAHVNKKAEMQAAQYSSPAGYRPPSRSNQPYSPKISAPSTPTVGKATAKNQGHVH